MTFQRVSFFLRCLLEVPISVYFSFNNVILFNCLPGSWIQFVDIGKIFFAGYLIHYLPYFLVERTLFLHHYLPSLIFKLLLLAFMINHLNQYLPRLMSTGLIVLLFGSALYAFVKLLPLSYGSGDMTAEQILQLKWKPTWNLIIHKV